MLHLKGMQNSNHNIYLSMQKKTFHGQFNTTLGKNFMSHFHLKASKVEIKPRQTKYTPPTNQSLMYVMCKMHEREAWGGARMSQLTI